MKFFEAVASANDEIIDNVERYSTSRKLNFSAEIYAEVSTWFQETEVEKFKTHKVADKFKSALENLTPIDLNSLVCNFYRGRWLKSKVTPNFNDFGPPPCSCLAKNGRYNMNGQPVLYLSSSIDGVHFECASSCKKCSTPLSSSELRCVSLDMSGSGLKIVNLIENNSLLNIALDFCELIKECNKCDNINHYIKSQIISSFVKNAGYDGMLTPGVRGNGTIKYNNLVIFNTEDCYSWMREIC